MEPDLTERRKGFIVAGVTEFNKASYFSQIDSCEKLLKLKKNRQCTLRRTEK